MKRPVLYCAVSFCIGITLAYFFIGKAGLNLPYRNIPIFYPSILSFVLIILAATFLKNNILSHLFLYLAILFFGIAYYGNSLVLPADHIANFTTEEGRKVSIKGIITDDPISKKAFYGKEKISFTLKSNLLIDGSIAQGVTGFVKADVYVDKNEGILRFGDEVVMGGILLKPQGLKNPGLFDYSNYLRIKNIYAAFTVNGYESIQIVKSGSANTLPGRAYILRSRIQEAITRYVDKPYAGFLKAILIGDRSELENSITDDFVKTGTVHVLAISGLHIGLAAAIFLFVFKLSGIPKRFNLALTAVALVFYSFVAGSNPPVLRATIIFVIFVLGFLINREADILNSLSITAFLILLWNPKELFDPSFQLSFASVASIILFAPKIEEALKVKPNHIIKSASVSIAATAGVFPIVAKYFNIVSPIAILANLIVIPALFVIIAASFIFLLFNFLGIGLLAVYMGIALSFLSQAVFYANHILAQVPLAYFRIGAPSEIFIALYYTALFSLFFARNKKNLLISLVLAWTIMVWFGNFDPEKEKLRITFLDVGQGDSIFMQFPGKGTMLIDGGSGGIEGMTDMGKGVVAPYLWNKGIKRLDAVMMTHFHEDHLGGLLYILENFNVGCVIDSGARSGHDRKLYDKYIDVVGRKKIRRVTGRDGDEISAFSAVKIFIINPARGEGADDSNDDSVALKIVYKNFSALLCADIMSGAMERVMPYGEFLESDVVKMPHHGGSMGEGSTVKKFFELVSPKVSVISSSGKNRFSKVSKDTRAVLDSLDSANYETGKNGAIKITSDGVSFECRP